MFEACRVKDGFVLGVHRRRLAGGVRGVAGSPGFTQQVVQPGLEFQVAVQLDQRVAIRFAGVQFADLNLQFDIQLDGSELAGQVGHVPVFLQFFRQFLRAAYRQFGDFIQIGIDHVHVAAQAGQQAQRGLLAHPRYAGDVVHLVAHQRQVVDDQFGTHPELFAHALHIHCGAGHGVDQGDEGVDQLGHVLVTGGDHHRAAGGSAVPGQGADHVVGFHIVDTQQWQPQRADAGMQRIHLAAQVIGHGRTVGLVVLEQGVAEGRPLGVEHYCEGAVRILPAQGQQHVQHALDRAGRLAGGGGQRWQRVEGPVQIGGAINKNQGGDRISHASVQRIQSKKG